MLDQSKHVIQTQTMVLDETKDIVCILSIQRPLLMYGVHLHVYIYTVY